MAKTIRCYLAGGFIPLREFADWRDLVRSEVKGMEWYDPRTDTRQGSIATFVSEDLRGVEQCDLVFCYVTSAGDLGAAMECAHANARGIPVVLCLGDDVRAVHPFLMGIARRVFIGDSAGARYLTRLAEVGMEREFEVIHGMLYR